ncbi:hypothetical protein N9546_05485 [Flavobacteriaceae bacterium]|nr:hypothetical protein [Flavobacteriaceae bacterium]
MKYLGLIFNLLILILVIGFPNYQLGWVDIGTGMSAENFQYRSWFNIIFITIPSLNAVFLYLDKKKIDFEQIKKNTSYILLFSIIDLVMNFSNFTFQTSQLFGEWNIGRVEETMFLGGWLVLILAILNLSLAYYLNGKSK